MAIGNIMVGPRGGEKKLDPAPVDKCFGNFTLTSSLLSSNSSFYGTKIANETVSTAPALL